MFGPDQLQRDIDTFSGRCGQYVFISSASAYRKPVLDPVITEDVPLVNPYWPYSQHKAQCETLLRQSDLPFTIVRPSHTYRTGFTLPIGGDTAARRLEQGKPIILPGDGTSLWTITRSEDFAVPFVNLLGHPAALRDAFHITSHLCAYPWRRIVQAVASALGVEARIVNVPTDTLVRHRPDWTGPLWGDKAWTVLFDNTKVQAVAGPVPCSFTPEQGQARAAVHYRQRRDAGTADYSDDVDHLFDRLAADHA